MSDQIPEADRLEGVPHPREAARLFGQEAAEEIFLTAFNSDRLHHAWMITGPKGIGKATLAWRIAGFLLSQPAADGLFAAPPPESLASDPKSPVIRRLRALSEPRFALIRRPFDEKGGKLRAEIPVDEIRGLKSFFTMSAADGGRRVALIDAVDELNTNAANALLKLLEEPPDDTTLLLVCHQPARLLPTIRSRCRVLRCAPLAPDALEAALDQAGAPAGPEAPALAALAAGSAGRAIELTAHDGLKLYGDLIQLFAKLPELDRPAALALAESAAGRGSEARFALLLELLELFLARLARAGVSGPPEIQAAPGEALLFGRLAPDPATARNWAALQQTLGARARRGRAVNLDPAALILDMVLKLSNEAGRVPAL